MSSIELLNGFGNLPKIRLEALDGSQAEIYLQGAHITSWVPSAGKEQLFLSERAVFKPGVAIRGGVPVIFPQFSSKGPLPKHGFARTQTWDLEDVEPDGAEAKAVFLLRDSQTTRQIWNRHFEARLAVNLGGQQLKIGLQVSNPGDQPYSFTAALHTYFKVGDIDRVAIDGLGGLPYIDHTMGAQLRTQTEDKLRFKGEVDRVYPDAPPVLKILDSERVVEIQAAGFTDCVIWNPGPTAAAGMADLGNGYRQMVCVESAAVERTIMLLPGHTWEGTQILKT